MSCSHGSRLLCSSALCPVGVSVTQFTDFRSVNSSYQLNNNNNNVTLAEHTSDHGKQTNSSTKEKGEHG